MGRFSVRVVELVARVEVAVFFFAKDEFVRSRHHFYTKSFRAFDM